MYRSWKKLAIYQTLSFAGIQNFVEIPSGRVSCCAELA
jgi:hypothetical protein